MNEQRTQDKRKTLGVIATLGVTALALPTRWQSPLINSVIVPAHAQTSFPASCSGFETEPVSEPISITVSDTEIRGPVVVARAGNQFSTTVTNNAGTCSDSSARTEVIEFSGTIDSATNTITGEFNVTQFCGDALACEQLTTYTATQVTPVPGDDLGDYQGQVNGTLRCCVDFL